jgi:hypothetical protein
MKLIIDLPDVTFSRLENLLRQGQWQSLNQAIIAAIESHLALTEGEEKPTEPIDALQVTAKSVGSAVTAKRSEARGALRLELIKSPAAAPMPPVEEVSGRRYHLFGISRLAPVKVGARALAILQGGGDSMNLSDFKERGAALARELGDALLAADDDAGRSRGDRLSAGFPRSGATADETAKSEDRYAFFVLGDVQKKKPVADGALYRLRLAAIEPLGDGEANIRITGPGLEFARIPNPLVDGPGGELDRAFSEQEAEWYLRHVFENVPDERETIRRFLRYIAAGSGRPEDMFDAIARDYPDLSENARANVRACVIGRLLDLCLVGRNESRGYVLTQRGERVLALGASA